MQNFSIVVVVRKLYKVGRIGIFAECPNYSDIREACRQILRDPSIHQPKKSGVWGDLISVAELGDDDGDPVDIRIRSGDVVPVLSGSVQPLYFLDLN